MFSIGTITFAKETILSLNVRMSKIKTSKELDPKQRILDKTIMELEPSIVKPENVLVRPQVSLENKVYAETYDHHNKDDIQVDETLAKIQVQNL